MVSDKIIYSNIAFIKKKTENIDFVLSLYINMNNVICTLFRTKPIFVFIENQQYQNGTDFISIILILKNNLGL